MRLDWLLFCLCAGLAIWAVQVVCTCRDRGLVTRVTLLLLAGKAFAEAVKYFRAAGRRALT
jgi:hypothetical protein